MKRFTYALLAGCILLFISCEKNNSGQTNLERGEYDFLPAYIVLSVEDKDSNNLIDPDFSGNILGNDITMEHNGKVYERLDYCSAYENVQAKALPPVVFRGLQTYYPEKNGGNGSPCLVIGFFEQTNKIEGDEYIVNWGDGSKDVIGYSQVMQWTADYETMQEVPDFKQNTWLNGVALESNIVKIVK